MLHCTRLVDLYRPPVKDKTKFNTGNKGRRLLSRLCLFNKNGIDMKKKKDSSP